MPHSGHVATDRAVGNGATAIDATTFKNGTVTAYCAVDNCSSAKDPPPVLPVLPRIVLLIAVSDPALETPPPQPLPATVFSLMVVFWIVNVPPSLEMPPPKGGRNPTINAWLLFTVELTIVMVPTL